MTNTTEGLARVAGDPAPTVASTSRGAGGAVADSAVEIGSEAPAPPPPGARRLAEAARIRRLLVAILVLHLVAAIYFARDLLLPVVLGALFALTFSPLVRAAGRAGLPAPVAALALVLLIGGGGVGGLLYFGGTAAELVDEAPRLGALLRQKLAGLNASVEAVKDASEEVEKLANSALASDDNRVVVAPPGMLSSAVGDVASIATTLAVAFTLALFLLAAGRGLNVKIVRLFPRFRDKRRALETVQEIELRISRYLLTITAINAVFGALIFLGFLAIGMPYPHLWGLAAFLLNFMPYIGTVIGTTLSAAVAIVTFDSLGYAALAPAIYLGLGSLEGQVATPAILGRRLEIDTVAVLLSLLFWTWAWGVAGALIAAPMLVLFQTIAERVEGLAPAARLLGAGESTEATVRDGS